MGVFRVGDGLAFGNLPTTLSPLSVKHTNGGFLIRNDMGSLLILPLNWLSNKSPIVLAIGIPPL